MKLQLDKLGKVSLTVDKDSWSSNKAYDRLVVVYNEADGISYISRKPVPVSASRVIDISNREYWLPIAKTVHKVIIDAFTLLSNIALLPTTESAYEGPYLINGVAYFWVGTDGDTQNGHYQSINIKGETGADGKSAYQLWLESSEGDPSIDIETWLSNLKGNDGVDGQNGYTPYIGSNGNWWINGEDTGKPSRGVQGPQGPEGSSSGGGTNIYINENDNTIRIPINVSNNPYIVISQNTVRFSSIIDGVTIEIFGYNLTSDIQISYDDTYYVLTYEDTINPNDILTKPTEDGIQINLALNRGVSIPTSGFTDTIIISSVIGEFTQKTINVLYAGLLHTQQINTDELQ